MVSDLGPEVESRCQAWLTFNEPQALHLTGVSHLIPTLPTAQVEASGFLFPEQ